MPPPFSQLTSAFANHSIKHVYSMKNRNQHHQPPLSPVNQARRSSSSSSESSLPSLSSSSASISTGVSAQTETVTRMMPSLQQIDEVRHAWESVCERRHRKDHPSVSAAHAFGLVFYNVLFEMDPSLKFKLGNVIRQARVLAEIMSYLTRSPSIKGEAGSLKDLNAVHRSNSKKETSSIYSSTTTTDHQKEDGDDHQHLCAVHAAAAAAAATSNAYAELEHRPHRFSNSDYHPVPIPPPSPTSFTYNASTNKQFEDDVCPFNQQEQEEKYQQQLLHQQQHQEELEKQRHSIQQDLQFQMERKLALQQQEENKWFGYKLREVGIKYVEEYDLVPENLDVFGPALIAALKSRLQDEFSAQMEQAWRKVKKRRYEMGMHANFPLFD